MDAGEAAFRRLEADLRVLTSGPRLSLLYCLREPRTLRELRIQASGVDGLNPNRPLSRTALLHHLKLLAETGLVETLETRRDGRPAKRYVVNGERLAHLSVALHALAPQAPQAPPATPARRSWSLDDDPRAPALARRRTASLASAGAEAGEQKQDARTHARTVLEPRPGP